MSDPTQKIPRHRRIEVVSVHLAPDEYRRIVLSAAKAGMDPSAWLRELALRNAPAMSAPLQKRLDRSSE